MTPDELQAIRKLCDAQPPAPWGIKYSPVMGCFLECGAGIKRKARARLAKMSGPEQLLLFAASARVAIPALLDEVEQLRDHLRAAMEEARCNSAYCEGWEGDDRCTCWRKLALAAINPPDGDDNAKV